MTNAEIMTVAVEAGVSASTVRKFLIESRKGSRNMHATSVRAIEEAIQKLGLKKRKVGP